MLIWSFIATYYIVALSTTPAYSEQKTEIHEKSKITVKLLNKMKHDHIIPDVLLTPPHQKLPVLYVSIFGDPLAVNFGNQFDRTEIKDPPTVKFSKSKNLYYTYIMLNIDADAIYNDHMKNYQPHIVVNIARKGKNYTQDVLSSYRIPDAPHYKNLTRMVFLVYEQPDYIPFTELRNRTFTQNFYIRAFVKKYNLGRPLYGNYCFIFENNVGGKKQKIPIPRISTTVFDSTEYQEDYKHKIVFDY